VLFEPRPLAAVAFPAHAQKHRAASRRDAATPREPRPEGRGDVPRRARSSPPPAPKRKASPLLDTRVIFCGDNLQKLADFPDAACAASCGVDLIYIDPPFNSNRNYEVFWGETREKRSFADRHASTAAYIEFMRSPQGAPPARCHPERVRRRISEGGRVERVSPCAFQGVSPRAQSRGLAVVGCRSFPIPRSEFRIVYAFFRRSGKSIIALTVQKILSEQIAKNWRRVF